MSGRCFTLADSKVTSKKNSVCDSGSTVPGLSAPVAGSNRPTEFNGSVLGGTLGSVTMSCVVASVVGGFNSFAGT